MVDIHWKRRTMSDYVHEFLAAYGKYKADTIYCLGFSYGAMICFIASSQVKVDTQILCSLSPYFAEDLPTLKKSWFTILGKNRMKAFEQYHAKKLVKQIHCQTILLRGSQEPKIVEKSNNDIYPLLKGKKQLYLIPGAKHDIANVTYQKQIAKIISRV